MLEQLPFYGPIIIMVGIAISMGLLFNRENQIKFQANEKLLACWRPLAAANDLIFSPGRYRLGAARPASVSGIYRGHHLELDIFRRADDDQKVHVYTRLRLSLNWDLVEDVRPPNPPPQIEVKEVVGRLMIGNAGARRWPIHTRSQGRELYYEQLGIETNTDYLQALFDILGNQAEAHLEVVALGSEALFPLQKITDVAADSLLRSTADQLLRGIARETQLQFESRLAQIVCARCLARYGSHTMRLSFFNRLTYYGCRICRQSRDYLEAPRLLAILDNRMSAESRDRNGVLQINWLVRRTLFDFDGVMIVRATDEEVERFAVQVGNDTDAVRQARYPHLRCVIAAEAGLSPNTLRILQRTFGQIEVGGKTGKINDPLWS